MDSYFFYYWCWLALCRIYSHALFRGPFSGVLISQLRAKEHPGLSSPRDESKVRKPHVCLNTKKVK